MRFVETGLGQNAATSTVNDIVAVSRFCVLKRTKQRIPLFLSFFASSGLVDVEEHSKVLMKVHPVNLEIDTLANVKISCAKLALERLVGKSESCCFVPVRRVSQKGVEILRSELEPIVRT